MATTVTSKGQVTIPKPVRDRPGIEPGNAVDFVLASDGRVILMKADGKRPRGRFRGTSWARRLRTWDGRDHGAYAGRRMGVTLVDTNVLLDVVSNEAEIGIATMPRPALFLAGKVFQRYRAAGGARTGVLPDFFIGAHAAIAGLTLLTRDARRYRIYFPRINLVSP